MTSSITSECAACAAPYFPTEDDGKACAAGGSSPRDAYLHVRAAVYTKEATPFAYLTRARFLVAWAQALGGVDPDDITEVTYDDQVNPVGYACCSLQLLLVPVISYRCTWHLASPSTPLRTGASRSTLVSALVESTRMSKTACWKSLLWSTLLESPQPSVGVLVSFPDPNPHLRAKVSPKP